MARRHLIIPDAQIKPGQNLDHIDWAAQAIVEYRPDVIVVIGDWWDMSSLSTHEAPGSKEAEGRRVKPDHVKHGIVCGRFYNEHESYRPKDVQNSEWNGILVLNQVKDGDFDMMPLRMSYLERKYG